MPEFVGRQTTEDDSLTTLKYLLEVWAGAGLLLRVALHTILWGALRARQGHDDWTATDVETGLCWGTAIRTDDVEETMTATDRALIQSASALLGAPAMFLPYWTASSVSNLPVLALVAGPSVLVVIGDPFWGLIEDLR